MQGTESLRHCGNLCPGIGRLIYTRFIAEFPCIRLEVGVEHKARYGGQFLCILHQMRWNLLYRQSTDDTKHDEVVSDEQGTSLMDLKMTESTE